MPFEIAELSRRWFWRQVSMSHRLKLQIVKCRRTHQNFSIIQSSFTWPNNDLKTSRDLPEFSNVCLTLNGYLFPSRSPHFGGLGKVGIKNVKHHLRREAGNAYLTFESLHSYPLTPGHFLIDRPVASIYRIISKGFSNFCSIFRNDGIRSLSTNSNEEPLLRDPGTCPVCTPQVDDRRNFSIKYCLQFFLAN